MTFDNHIDLGNILTLFGLAIIFWRVHISNVKRINKIEFRVTMMWHIFARKFDLPENLDEPDETKQFERGPF